MLKSCSGFDAILNFIIQCNKQNNTVDNPILDILFPKFCLGCQKEGTYLCDDCRHLLDINEFDYCLCSNKPIQIYVPTQGKCHRCQNKILFGLYCALPYKHNLTKKLIYQFKYKPYLKDLSKTLASVIVEHFVLAKKNTENIWQNSVLIPVPTDKKKLKSRGYNQSEELAKELSKIIKVPVILNNLIKIKQTEAQMKLKKEEREKNLVGAFSINKNFVKSDFTKFSKVFLVDDVYTTGSTMEECAKTLYANGAKQVWGIAIAREG